MRQVEHTGQAIIITDHGRPTLELRPYLADRVNDDPLICLKGTVLKYTDPTEPISEDDWDALS